MLRSQVNRSTHSMESASVSAINTSGTRDDQAWGQLQQDRRSWDCNDSPTEKPRATKTGTNDHDHARLNANIDTVSATTEHERPTDVLQMLRVKRPTTLIATGSNTCDTGAEKCSLTSPQSGEVGAHEVQPQSTTELSDLVRSVETSLARAAQARATAVAAST